MPQDMFYRYISSETEWERFITFRVIQSTNPRGHGRTWFTNERYSGVGMAQAKLSLPTRPLYLVGPIPEDEMPYFDVCAARRVEPGYDQPGGGIEFCTTRPVVMFNVEDLRS